MLLDIFFLFIQFSRCSLSRTVSSLSGFPKISPRQTSQITFERLPRLLSSFFLRTASRCVCKHHACAGGLNTRVTLCLFGLCASRINPAHFRVLVGLSGLEPPTSRLSGVRSNRLSYKPIESGIHLLSHAVSSIVPSADQVLTVVFGMGTGVSPDRIDTRIL